MKIQELAIVFILIILPISLLLSEYTQTQIKILKLQTEYDAKLTAATYDAIKAFQLNAKNETYSDLATSKMENIEASVNSFRNSIMAAFKLNGLSEENINNYIPALVFTLYDGFYIYSPFANITEVDPVTEDVVYNYNSGNMEYGLKSYINYSCRYQTANVDAVITYALDNYIKVEGWVDGKYVNRSGYLIDGTITVSGSGDVTYNGVTIEEETLIEYIPITFPGKTEPEKGFPYMKYNGTKYYLYDEPSSDDNDRIIYVANGKIRTQYVNDTSVTDDLYDVWALKIRNNNFAKQYYEQAKTFTDWFKGTSLQYLTYDDAIAQVVDSNGVTQITKIWPGDTRKIFIDGNNNIENELSNFNQHRLKVIRNKIEVNLAIAIANYNEYSNATNVFQMPLIQEDEWDQIVNNISLISFLQGLNIGGKAYNGYTIVTNSESEEVVLEENIYILGQYTSGTLSGTYAYFNVGDKVLWDGTVQIDAKNYGTGFRPTAAGRLNIDFHKVTLAKANDNASDYFYPLNDFDASYSSIVMQDNIRPYNNIWPYDDIYKFVETHPNALLKKTFYTALARERASKYNTNINVNI